MKVRKIISAGKDKLTYTEGTMFSILVIISVSHLLNDMIQSVVPAIYPIIKDKLYFTFAQIGLITHTLYMATLIEDVS